MYRSVGVSKRLVSTPGRPVIRVVTRSRYRRFATTTPEPPKPTTLPLSNPSITTTPKSNAVPPNSSLPPPPKPKKSGFVRRVLLFTSVFATTFYGGSVYFSLQNEPYHDFFVESVPLGQTLMDIAEQAGYGDSSRPIREKFDHRVSKTSAKVKEARERADAKKAKVAEKLKDEKERLQNVAGQLKTQKVKTEVTKGVESVKETAKKAQDVVVTAAVALSDDVRVLASEAENALKGIYPTTWTLPAAEGAPSKAPEDDHVYRGPPLPLGWEPAPGYHLAKTGNGPKALSAPTVSSLDGSDPMLAHLVSTLDKLSSLSSTDPTAAKVLETAKGDLADLNTRLSKIKADEKDKLEKALEDRAKEFHVKMLEMEMEAQDKIDGMDEEWRKYFDSEKSRVVETYRNKLNAELETQSELIDQRLKEEVIAQGIEMQRRWIREVKVRVEQERGGRLAKLDELSASIARLERLTSDNALYLSDNLRAHALWSALRALSTTALSSSTRTPFREELRVLKHISSARDDPVINAALETLDGSDVPDTGIEPLKDLSAWFDTSVLPHVSAVALVPDSNAGLLSYIASSLLTKFQFKREGKVEGGDVLSVLSRARYHLSERDLDSAARELNQLGGPSKELLKDWLDAARRRLEVEQALEVVEAQAKLASLLVVA